MEKCKNLPRVIQFPPDLIHLDSDYKTEIKAVVTQVLNGPGLFMIKFTAMYEKLCYYGIMRMGKVIYNILHRNFSPVFRSDFVRFVGEIFFHFQFFVDFRLHFSDFQCL